LWEPYPGTTGAPRTQLAGHGGPIRAMAFAPDGITMATAGTDLTLRVWSLSRIRSTERAAVPLIAEINAMTYFVDGKTVASAGADGVIRLWDMTAMTPRVRAELKGHDGAVRELVMTPDGKALASVGDDLRVINWDPQSGKPMQQWQLAVEGASAFALTLDGRYLACGTATGKLDLYRVAEKR
ncbi:MAG TPA: hypothetical protein VLM40_03120, partial [Gemmata sp.]|nr:hypothetical protein [Gemmata sp.]